MEKSEQTNKLPKQLSEVALKLNQSVISVISSDALVGFQKAYAIAIAAGELKTALSPEYMKPIMDLQGNKLGFKTDKDKDGGYPEPVVKNCLIEAVLTGVQPFGNQFNIISGNCYITKEGFGYLLKNTAGLWYEIIPELPRIKDTSAAIVMRIRYSQNGGEVVERQIDIPIKVNSFMGADAVIGKATRKARAWLFNSINGTEIADGDISDKPTREEIITEARLVEPEAITQPEAADVPEAILKLIETAPGKEQLAELYDEHPELHSNHKFTDAMKAKKLTL